MSIVGLCRDSLKQIEPLTPTSRQCKTSAEPEHTARPCATSKLTAQQNWSKRLNILGWLPDPGIPNDDYHNAKLERLIRSIKEGVRSIHLKAGFSHDLWPRSVEYFCVARSFSTLAPIHPNERDEVKTEKSMLTCYETANGGSPFTGLRIPLCALVYYKPPKHRALPVFSPRTFPGIFVGWRVDAGFVHRNVPLILDYENLRTKSKGFGRPIQVYPTELVEPSEGDFIFPLYEASVAKLNLFQPSVKVLQFTPPFFVLWGD